ncbi:RNA-directed RNA polymerase [Flagelloscypha sp. PMI_526]|nr:RNA-directed RNA polymerase [Flagelloscypha sp. PMI_526]
MNVAKRAKRIGLLFSEASQDLTLDPQWVADIPDLVSGDGEVFSDGCGLMSRRLAVQLAKNKNIVYRGTRYTPTVVQIRYKGYKGVLSLDPTMPEGIFAQFRKSMKKFTASVNNTFSVVGHSQPFTFGRLNNDVIVLLSALGITNEMFLQKQQQYFNWIIKATDTLEKSFNFLCALRLFDEAENVLLSEDQEKVQKGIRKAQLKELSAFTKEGTDKFRSRILMEKSRLLYGICDPYGVLKEGQVHVKVLTSKGRSTAIHTDVLVVRNPCLYPGDCLKLRAVQHPKLDHLIDCLVFAADAKAGHHSAPSMSSGGDLDGDQYFVCWDPDIVPKTVAQERLSTTITRENLANYFAQYNNASVARVSALHAKWVRASAKGALSPECQELNALHSQSVDGARIKIPDRLTLPPELREGYIIDLLAAAAKKFQEEFSETLKAEGLSALPSLDRESGFALLNEFLQNPRTALTEYELFNLVMRFSDRHHLTNDEIMAWLSHLDWSAIAFNEKHAILSTLKSKFNLVLSPERFPQIWNSLFEELQQRNLNHPFSMQRLYSSRISGLGPFWKYLRQTTQDFTRKLILFKTDERFVLAVFIRDDIPWNEEPEVADNVVVYSFLPETSDTFSTLRTMTKGYRLHCSFGIFELYNKIRRDTFIFISKPARGSPDEIIASVALQKISAPCSESRVNRTPIVDVEMHVVSNRDRIAHQAFDQWFEHNPTEEFVGRFDYERTSYRRFELDDIDWKSEEYRSKEWMRLFLTQQDVRAETILRVLGQKTDDEIFEVLDLAYTCHQDEVFFASFSALITLRTSFGTTFVVEWIKKYPLLVFIDPFILQSIVLCANEHSVASLAALQILQHEVVSLPLSSYSELLWVAANSLRARQVAQEVLLVLNDGRLSDDTVTQTPEMVYANRNLLGVVFDRAEEAFEECPCNEDGRPRHQKTAPAHLKSLRYLPEDKGGGTEKMIVAADMRVDSTFPARLHSHVRLQGSLKGEIHISLVHPPPPDFQRMEWNLYHAGSTATSKAMLDAIITLLEQRRSACGIYPWIVGIDITSEDLHTGRDSQEFINAPTLNESQNIAVQTSLEAPLSLIWGPPGKFLFRNEWN